MSGISGFFVKYLRQTNKLLLLVSLLISAFGLIAIKSAQRAYNTDYFKTQLVAVIIGYVFAFIITLIDYHEYGNLWYLVAGFCIFLMLYTLAFATSVQSSGGVNARAWITIAGRSFQPSELVKIGFMVTFAKHASSIKENGNIDSFLHVASLGVHALIPMALCHLQGDDGAAIIFFFMFIFMSFAAGVKYKYFIGLFSAILVMVPIIWNTGFLAEYQKLRFTSIFHLDDPNFDRNTIYQQIQGRTSIGSGKFLGQGLFEGPRVTNGTVPFQHSDYIFSTIGEELGFVGCCFALILIFALLAITVYCAVSAKDTEGALICYGFCGLIASQTIFNIGMCLTLLPVMGVTLPFFSAGGSSAMCLYFGLGLVQNVAMRNSKSERTMLRKNYAANGYVG